MKKSILTIICFLFCLAAFSQTLDETLRATFDQFSNAADMPSMKSAANRFSLIAKKWPQEWIASYYAAYGQTLLSTIEQDNQRKKAMLEEADNWLSQALAQGGTASDEVHTLKAMIASMHIGIEPDQWQKYLGIFATSLKKAKELGKENPRIYYVEGTNQFYTPEAFGGGGRAARPYFEKAKEYFEREKTDNIRKPFWGKQQNLEMLKKCSE